MKKIREYVLKKKSFLFRLKYFFRTRLKNESDSNLRETLEELIDETIDEEESIASDERVLLGNVLNLRDLTAHDIMTPRADMIAIPDNLSQEQVLDEFTKTGLSWLVVYNNNLDNVIGVLRAKDVLSWMHSQKKFFLKKILKDVMFISPAMRTLDLLLMMKKSGTKLAVVVDEYGGVDGLVTFQQLIETIVGDLEDSNENIPTFQLNWRSDGAVLADGRCSIEEFEKLIGGPLNLIPEEEDIETLNGLVIYLAGRVPVRGEVIKHHNQIEFEILDADPRYVKQLCIRNIPIKMIRKAIPLQAL